MIKVAAITSGENQPSARHRFRQNIEILKKLGIDVDEYTPRIDKYAGIPGWPKKIHQFYAGPFFLCWLGIKLATRIPGILGSWRHHITWLEREMIPRLPSLEFLLKRPLVLDIDDAIWLRPPSGKIALKLIAKQARLAIAGNSFIAEWLSPYCKDIQIVPTAVDSELFQPGEAEAKRSSSRFTIGWIGSWDNLPYLWNLKKPLTRFLQKNRDARLLVMANVMGEWPNIFDDLPSDQVCFTPWSGTTEGGAVQAMDVGLMPLPFNDWARGKCSSKMLQYMSCGIPAIVTPIGMNAEVLAMAEVGIGAKDDDDWYEAFKYFYDNPEQGIRFGRQGRRIVEEHFSCQVVSKKLADIFKGCL